VSYYDDLPSQKKIFGLGVAWLVGILVVCAVIGAAVWGIGVATSDVAGRGNQRRAINSSDNRTFAQEQFEELFNDVKTYDAQISTSAAAAAAETEPTEKSRLNQVTLGVTNQCISTVQQYNAEARKVSKERFRAADLPAQIDDLDPSTDCKGASK
jgi:hypothetical protein